MTILVSLQAVPLTFYNKIAPMTGCRMQLIKQRPNAFEKCLDFMSLHAIKCYRGSIFVCN